MKLDPSRCRCTLRVGVPRGRFFDEPTSHAKSCPLRQSAYEAVDAILLDESVTRPTRPRYTFTIDRELAENLEREKTATGLDESEVISRALRFWFEHKDDAGTSNTSAGADPNQ